MEEYFSKGLGGASETSSVNTSKIQQAFDKYKDAATGNIEIEGLQRFFEDLGVNAATDLVTMLISQRMNAANMGVYTFAEFQAGFKALGVSTVEELKRNKLPGLYQELRNPEEYKRMYKYVYNYARDKSKKNMQVEMAVDLWELLLAPRCSFLPLWVDFLQTEKKDQVAIPADTWNMLLELVDGTKGDLANFVDDGTWPPIIDQFIEWYGKKQAGK